MIEYQTILNERYSVGVLLFIHDHGEVMTSEMYGIVTSHRTLLDLLAGLEICGLVHVRKVETPHLTRFHSLTPNGIKVAEFLKCADSLIDCRDIPTRQSTRVGRQ